MIEIWKKEMVPIIGSDDRHRLKMIPRKISQVPTLLAVDMNLISNKSEHFLIETKKENGIITEIFRDYLDGSWQITYEQSYPEGYGLTPENE